MKGDCYVKSEDIIYLDSEFVSLKYEELTNESPTILITKEQGMGAGVGIPFLKSDLHSKEVKQYKISTYKMWLKIAKEMNQYPSFQPGNFSAAQTPITAWINGTLSTGEWTKGENEKDHINVFFEIQDNLATYALLICDEYFSSNFNTLQVLTPALQRYIQIPVQALVKVFYALEDIKTYVVCPYVILI